MPSRLDFDADASVQGLRVGYFPEGMKKKPATEVDRAALEAVPKLGVVPVEVGIPDWLYGSLSLILFADLNKLVPIWDFGARLGRRTSASSSNP